MSNVNPPEADKFQIWILGFIWHLDFEIWILLVSELKGSLVYA